MKTDSHLLTIRFDGTAVSAARIPVMHLLKFLANFNKALQRTGRVLQGQAESVRRGQSPRSIRNEVDLDLVMLTHGSPAAVLGFERRLSTPSFPDLDFGLEILECSIQGLGPVQASIEQQALPPGYDRGVLMAWRDAGVVLSQGVERIELTLSHRENPIKAAITIDGFRRLQQQIQGPEMNIRTIEGRLLMADFKEHGTRCRIHPSAGEPILCLFEDEQKDEVLEDILQYVRVVGEATEDPVSGKITSIKIHDIERLDDRQDEATELLPKGTPVASSFWESPTLDDLARSQSVNPLASIRALFGTWPGEPDDSFEQAVDELRHGLAGGNASK